jgi:hypothetical protein
VSRNHVRVTGDGITVTVTYGQEDLNWVIEMATAATRELMEVQQGLSPGARRPRGPVSVDGRSYLLVQAPDLSDCPGGYNWWMAEDGSGELRAVPRE